MDSDRTSREWVRDALLIRRVEETFLRLFERGELNGTIHTCIGQELSALAFAGQLRESDTVFSNHRCHGHFLAFTGDVKGLVGELMGRAVGVCGGVGSSQHLCRGRFYSNGVQGGTVPVAAGAALARRLGGTDDIVCVFIGDGTLGQGVVYEALNIAAKWQLPLLVVCEHNGYAQSTATGETIAGDIEARAEAFGIPTARHSTREPESLLQAARASIALVRETGQPAFVVVDTNRLAPHSRGDDTRSEAELAAARGDDPLQVYSSQHPEDYQAMLAEVGSVVESAVAELRESVALRVEDYITTSSEEAGIEWRGAEPSVKRQVEMLHECLARRMEEDGRTLLLGEDIAAPYGGAFKVTRDLSARFPGRVFSTPISEAAIVGIANGLALAGYRPIVEIMFGDFVTLALDQLINHASKFHHMYNRQVTCPIVLRTPMGGGRGYGPTHSQTLDKFLAGIDNVTLAVLNSLIDPARIYESVFQLEHPAVVIENKLDYGRRVVARQVHGYVTEVSSGPWPWARIRPRSSSPDVTVVTYGGMVDVVVAALEELFMEHDIKAEVLAPSRLCPFHPAPVLESLATTRRLTTVEEGSALAGIGGEIIAQAAEAGGASFRAKRIAALPVPIPSVRSLEEIVLPTRASVISAISEFLG
jgi:2-oxoisovalerate dehydrogenase E1 component